MSARRLPALLLALSLAASALAAPIDPSRLPASGWSGTVGIPGGVPTNYTLYVNLRTGQTGNGKPYSGTLAAGNGVTDDAPAINAAVAACPDNEYIYLPAGTYRLNSGIARSGINNFDGVLHPFSILIKGDGPAQTKLLYYGTSGPAISFKAWSDFNGNISYPIASGDARGSTAISVGSSWPGWLGVAPGNLMMVHRVNAEADPNDYYLQGYEGDADSQIVAITAVNPATNTISFSPALNESYPSDYVTIPFSTPYRCGVQDLYIENKSDNGLDTIQIQCGNQCWIKNVESYNASAYHVRLYKCYRCEVRECLIHNGWNAGGNQDYGVDLNTWSCNNLIEDNVFYFCRHAMPMEIGGQGNVFGYNYSFDPVNSDAGPGLLGEESTDYLMGDSLNHGGAPRWNLREGNVTATIKFDVVLGGSSYNTAFRNRVQRRSVAATTIACFGSDIQWDNYNENLVGNVYEAPPVPTALRRWGTNQDSPLIAAISDVSNTFPAVVTMSVPFPLVSGDVVAISGVKGAVGVNLSAVTVTVIDPFHISLNGVSANGTYQGGGTVTGADGICEATAVVDGEYDFSSGTIAWEGSDHTLASSMYLTSKPAWFGSLTWPGVDPTKPAATAVATNPAVYRQTNGVPPTTTPYIVSQPSGVTASGGTASIMAVADGYPTPSFQWQVSMNGGTTWVYATGSNYSITTSAPVLAWHKDPTQTTVSGTYSGPVRSTLTILAASPALNGALYRCVVSNSPISAGTFSAPALLTVSN